MSNEFTDRQIQAKLLVKQKQRDLLWLINTKAGRHVLDIEDLKTPITEVFYNGFKFNDGGRQSIYRFYTRATVFRDLMPFVDYEEKLIRNYTSYLSRHLGIKEKYKRFLAYEGLEGHLQLEIPQMYNTDYYPDSGGDGWTETGPYAAWADCRNAVNANSLYAAASSYYLNVTKYSGNYYINRYQAPIDTSGIDDSATISSASFNFTTTATGSDLNNNDFCLVTCNPASNTSMAVGDYSTFGTTEQSASRINQSTANLSFALNATGIGNILKTGWSKFGMRYSQDLDNVAPTQQETANTYFNSANAASSKPYLSVTIPVPSAEQSVYLSPRTKYF